MYYAIGTSVSSLYGESTDSLIHMYAIHEHPHTQINSKVRSPVVGGTVVACLSGDDGVFPPGAVEQNRGADGRERKRWNKTVNAVKLKD